MKTLALIGSALLALLETAAFCGGLFCIFWFFVLKPQEDQLTKQRGILAKAASCGCVCADVRQDEQPILKEPTTWRSQQSPKE